MTSTILKMESCVDSCVMVLNLLRVFMAGDVGFEIVTFPTDAVREAPLSPVDGKPMRRARTAEVQALTQV